MILLNGGSHADDTTPYLYGENRFDFWVFKKSFQLIISGFQLNMKNES